MDQVANFIKGLVTGSHTSSATTINVANASIFPDPINGSYNLTWWDLTNYPDPTDDPNVEIVRVTAYNTSANTLTVTRAQEGTTASAKETSGSQYMLILTPTAKTITDLQQALYPVGSVYINASVSTNPSTLLGFGTWVAWGIGKAIVGIDTSDTDFDTAGETGGEKTHLLTSEESGLKSHQHGVQTKYLGAQSSHAHRGADGYSATASDPYTGNAGDSIAKNNTASDASAAHNNLPPYQVGYVWKRTA